MGKRRTHDEYVNELADKNPKLEVLGSFELVSKPISHRCKIHNVIWDIKPSSALRGCGCPKCHHEAIGNSKRLSNEEYCRKVEEINSTIIPMETYVNSNTKIKHLCTVCNNIWSAKPTNILQGKGCPKCRIDKLIQFNRISDDEYKAKLKQHDIVDIIPIENYINNHTPILHKCIRHNVIWKTSPASILHGSGCLECRKEKTKNRRKTHEQYVKELNEINPNIEVLEQYQGTNTKILHKCLIDGYEWLAQPANLLSGMNCPRCVNNIRKTHEDYIEEVDKINPNILVIGEYISMKDPIEHYCVIHDNLWITSPGSILKGCGCPLCGNKKIGDRLRKTQEEYEKELSEINPDIICLEKYININTSILHKCLKCNNEWVVSPSCLLQGHGCPKCISSKGEAIISDWLICHNINFIQQKNFEGCKDIKKLPFDFYLPDQNVCIEYDGEQHYKPIEFYGGEDGFKIRQKHDQIKNEYCKQNNILLLRIPYYADVEAELNNFLLAS